MPSAQSNRRRSPPRRTRVALSARFAVGMEPDVPRKTTSSSTAADCTRALKVILVWADTGGMRRMPEYRSSDLGRSLTLLRTFLLASAVILAAGAVALSSRLSAQPTGGRTRRQRPRRVRIRRRRARAEPRPRRIPVGAVQTSHRTCMGSTSMGATGVSSSRAVAPIEWGAVARAQICGRRSRTTGRAPRSSTRWARPLPS